MKTKTVAYIDQEDIPDDDTFEALYQGSTFCHPDEERGFSFMVRRDYLEEWLKDMVEDDRTGSKQYVWINSLVCQLNGAGHDCLFVCNDEKLRVK
jgi:hypothetical protein